MNYKFVLMKNIHLGCTRVCVCVLIVEICVRACVYQPQIHNQQYARILYNALQCENTVSIMASMNLHTKKVRKGRTSRQTQIHTHTERERA